MIRKIWLSKIFSFSEYGPHKSDDQYVEVEVLLTHNGTYRAVEGTNSLCRIDVPFVIFVIVFLQSEKGNINDQSIRWSENGHNKVRSTLPYFSHQSMDTFPV
jgi:hypothetical protein